MGIDDNVKLKPFYTHGVLFNGSSGKQYHGDCPFCGKEDRFYVNKENGLWDCKRCGRTGNVQVFLGEVTKSCVEDLQNDRASLKLLAKDRKLPVDVFKEWNVGRSGPYFTVPIYNEHGYVQDIRRFKPGTKVRSTAGCSTGLLGLPQLVRSDATEPVYICEGEWDVMAMHWLLRKIKKPGVVVGSPGVSVFKKDWVPFFSNRRVYVMYDNDEAGEYGEKVITERLGNSTRDLFYLHWSPNLPKGYDVRDFVIRVGIQAQKPKRCYTKLIKMLRPQPRATFGTETDVGTSSVAVLGTEEEVNVPETTLNDTLTTLRKYLLLPDDTAFVAALSTVITNDLDGDPNWVFIVAPPGGTKTEMLNAFSKCHNVYSTSSLTANTLISGAPVLKGVEPSLLPRLNGKVLLIKDFTTIMGKHSSERDEIFSQLRDAYDGKSGKDFGTGAVKHFESHFSILAGVTPAIYQLATQHSALGERFIKICTGDNLLHHDEDAIIRKAISNLDQETGMRDEIATVTRNFLHHRTIALKENGLPSMSEAKLDEIVACAKWCSRLRGVAPRDHYRHEVMTGKPMAEVGTRLGKNFTRIGYGMAHAQDKSAIDDDVSRRIRQIALDTTSQQIEDIVRYLYLARRNKEDPAKRTVDIAIATKYSLRTLQRIMADLHILGIVDRIGPSNKYVWVLSEYIVDLTERAKLYTTEKEILRTSSVKKFKMKTKKKR